MREISVLVLLLSTLLLSSSLSYARQENERTLAMIKPDGLFGNYTNMIKNVILRSGFNIVTEMMVQLDVRNVTLFYSEHSGRSFFPGLLEYMTSGPVVVMVLEKPNAISHWRALVGPTDARKAKASHPYSIRAMCGLDTERNCVHGSDSPQSAAREISFFFGKMSPAMRLSLSDRPLKLHGTFCSSHCATGIVEHDEL